MLAAAELYPNIPVAMHQDHGNSPKTCQSAIDNGFTSVMMDGSLSEDGKTPADFAYNVQVTKTVVDLAHKKGVSVEGELGCLGSLEHGTGEQEDGHGATCALSHDQLLTDPEEAERFVAETGVDALAVAIGTSHGAYKFTRKPDGEVLAMTRIEEIHRRLPNCHLVMHGSSSVPQDLQDIINKFGGKMPQTWGVPVEEIQRGIKSGVRKINVDTDNRMAMTGAVRKVLMESPEKFDVRDWMKPAREAMKKVCAARMISFGQAGNADKIKPITLEEMAKRYKLVTV
jgi:fructose-bisphosphate aldolase class II